jgi:phenylalanyl-tRNA synthetase beta chain
MKFTLNWLKQPLDTKASLQEICDRLTAIGLEVEGVSDPAAQYAPFTVAYVESAVRHPNAEKLQVCMVKTKNGTLQVVCGAPNARAGMKGIFAPEGSYIPGSDITLKKTKIRDVESNGMLVSEREMLLSDEHKGIIEVDDKFEIGTPMADVFGLNDPVIEINLTPNRADCAGLYGIARDLAAAGLGTLKPVNVAPVKGKFKSPLSVKIEDNEGCPLFLGRYFKGVKNGPSPEWLQKLLKSVGLRPISALVDITNFVMLDHARPLHVYDADKLKGDISVRKTKGGEKLEALNDKTYDVAAGAVGIHDESGIIGLGGIIGGASTGCTEATTNVFLEAAYFTPARISRAGRDMDIITDARYRFERGVDPAFTATGIELATKLILELCGGEASEIVQAGKAPDDTRQFSYNPAYFEQLIGFDVSAKRQKEILEALGFGVAGKGPFTITAPSWRGDVEGKADIAEEIFRITGFDQLPATSVRAPEAVPHAAETPLLSRIRKTRTALTARGLDECVTWSFMGGALAQKFGLNDNTALTLKNPISSELDVMRPSILPNLIAAAGRNHAQGYSDVALCEVGPVFRSSKPDGQAMIAAGVRAGSHSARHWADGNAARDIDVFDAKADAIAALEACGAPAANAQISRDAPEYYHPGRSGVIRLGPNVLAYFGEIHPAILDDMGIKTSLSGFEIFLENIPETRKKGGTEKPLLRLEPLMPLRRDFAFLVDAKTEADTIIKAAKSADKDLIKQAEIFDVYAGKGVEDGKKSVALSVLVQPTGASMTDEQIEALSQKIINAVCNKTGGSLRS